MKTNDEQNKVAKYMRINENGSGEEKINKAMRLDTSSANVTIHIHSKHSKTQ